MWLWDVVVVSVVVVGVVVVVVSVVVVGVVVVSVVVDVTLMLVPLSNFRSSNNLGFSGIWKHAIPDFTWQYTTYRSEFRTTVQPSGNVTGRTVASKLVWLPSSSFPLSPSSLSALATLGSGNFFD